MSETNYATSVSHHACHASQKSWHLSKFKHIEMTKENIYSIYMICVLYFTLAFSSVELFGGIIVVPL